ncbi:hypothetical protein [Lysinibacillus piscis]|uniref:hypothetical protein n=1 Tax=Lysinibacillus piscis TaxID=2518931 RepID=UPI002230D182|nr:hypothetical protein [Lysinibacillus sp. KH24]
MPIFTSIQWVSKRLYLLLTLRFRTKKIALRFRYKCFLRESETSAANKKTFTESR